MQTKLKECDIERGVADHILALEGTRLTWLKGEQLREKQEIFEKYLPSDSVIKEVAQEGYEEEMREIEQFKREQEIERARKLQEILKLQETLQKDLQD